MLFLADLNIPEICWVRIYFLLYHHFNLMVDSCVEIFSVWKWRQMWASFWNFGHFHVLLFRFMMVPEGYVGSETPLCFVPAKRSSQICIPEPVLSGVLGNESRLYCHVKNHTVIQHWWHFHGAWVSKKFVVSQMSVCVPRGNPAGSEAIITGFRQDLNWCLHRQIIQLNK